MRAAVREGRSGDVARVWEWIGGIGGVRSSNVRGSELSGNGRRHSGRLSLSSPSGAGDESNQEMTASRRESRRWDEGRPIY